MKKAIIRKEENEKGKFRIINTNGEYRIEFQPAKTRGYQERGIRAVSESEAVKQFEELTESMDKIKTEAHFATPKNESSDLETKESVKKYMVPKLGVKLVREGSVETGGQAVTSPSQINEMLMEHMRYLDREHFNIVLLNAKNKVIGVSNVSIGSLSASIVHPREVFKPAILAGAASIILSHKHPSGDPSPSQEDLEVTRRLNDAGNIMGIAVRDHVIIGDGCFFSFREKGLL